MPVSPRLVPPPPPPAPKPKPLPPLPREPFQRKLAARLRTVAGDLTYQRIGQMTRTHPENVRRYLLTGSATVQFLAAFCDAFEVDPRWVLYGTGKMHKG
jgi:hypothetical protein